MGVALILTALLYLDLIEIWHFLVLVFVTGSAQAFGGPAYQALIPGLVERKDVSNAVALNSIQFNLARIIGPVIAGAAFATLGAVFCFGLNAVSFLAVIAALMVLRTTFVPPKVKESVYAQIKQGFVYIKDQGDLWQLTILGFVSTFCGVPLLTLLPVFARDIFGLDVAGYSNMMALSGAGSITGALLYARYSRMSKQGVFTLWVQVIFALFLALFAISRSLPVSCILLFLTGVCLISLFSSITSLVQLATSEEMRGRMMSIFMLAFRGGMPLGDLFAGFVASRVSPTFALLALSLILVCVAASFLVSNSGVKRL
jgi:predicted MFS family arabinose efflux permease